MHRRHRSHAVLIAATAALLLAACDDAPPEQAERIRAIKPYFVAEPAGGDVRRYSGTMPVNWSISGCGNWKKTVSRLKMKRRSGNPHE